MEFVRVKNHVIISKLIYITVTSEFENFYKVIYSLGKTWPSVIIYKLWTDTLHWKKKKENAVFRNYWDLLSYLYNAEVEVGKRGNVSKTKESFAL